MIFTQRRQGQGLDQEEVETAMRSALHRAGAAALTQLWPFPAPAAEPRTTACAGGEKAHYLELRSKPILTALGPVDVSRPYYVCPGCHVGQFPADRELDIENTAFSPGVRRMQAMVGQDAPFDRGREPMKVLAGLEVTAQSVERTAEALSGDIAQRELGKIQHAWPVDRPALAGEPMPILDGPMDGTGVPGVNKETRGRKDPDPHCPDWHERSGLGSRLERAGIRRLAPACTRPPQRLGEKALFGPLIPKRSP